MVTGGIFLPAIIDLATNITSPVHFYVYDYINEMTFNTMYGPCTKKLGVSHGDEMVSLFPMEGQETLKGDDLKVSRLMVDLWTRFARDEYVMRTANDTQLNGFKRSNFGVPIILLSGH